MELTGGYWGCLGGWVDLPWLLARLAQVFRSISGLASSESLPPCTETTVLDPLDNRMGSAWPTWRGRRTGCGLADPT